MAAWGAMGPGTRVLILVVAGVAAVGGAYLGWQALRPDNPGPVAASVEATTEPSTAPEAAPVPPAASEPAAAPEPGVAPETVAAPDLPKIDTWRVAPDGEALVAGLAAPGAKVEVIVDDRPVAEGVALASGEFVLQFTLSPNPAPSLLRLAMTPPGGLSVASPEMVALAPIAGPEPVAAQPEPAKASQEPAETEIADAGAPTALLVTDEGAVVLQDKAPATAMPDAQVMIDAISYAPTGAVQIGGRGAAGATLRLYLDNAEAAMTTVPESGRWLVTLGDTPPGIYMLRVDQMDADGKVTSRFETPFKRETIEALALAANASAPQAKPEGEPKADPATAAAPKAAAAPADAPAVGPVADGAVATADPAAAPVADVDTGAGAGQVADAEPAAGPAPDPEPAPSLVSITVQPGFTLWGIAQKQLGDGVLYVQVFDANREKIKNPDLIYPGQVFSIPAASP